MTKIPAQNSFIEDLISYIRRDSSYFDLLNPELRKSPARIIASVTVQPVTEMLHYRIPWISPTHLNFSGVVGVGIGAIWAREPNRSISPSRNSIDRFFLLSLLIFSESLDVFDGTLAR